MSRDRATPPQTEPQTALCHCHALRQATRRATAIYDAAMARHGLRISQYSLLVRLARSGPLPLQALAAELVLDRTTLGRNLRPLERDGLVASEADPADKRVRRLLVTQAGRTRIAEARPAWLAAQTQYESQFGPARASTLRQELRHLTLALEETPDDQEALSLGERVG